MAKQFRIEDWAGNILEENGRFYPPRSPWVNRGKLFPSFEDAWGHLYEKFDHLPEDEFNEQMGEFYVMEVADA